MSAELIERVEKATQADREIDGALAIALWPESRSTLPVSLGGAYPETDYGPGCGAPEFTRSIDAALSLVSRVLPGWDWSVHSHKQGAEPSHRDAWAGVRAPPKGNVSGILYEANGYTPALAICLALLRAVYTESPAE